MEVAMNRHVRRGFTVTEMMVVIGVFVVLIGLVIPATSKVRTSAMRTQCLTQMRGLQFAYLAYAHDHNGRLFPFGAMVHTGLTEEQIEKAELPYWYFFLQEYYEAPLVLKSPLDDSKHWPQSMGGQGTVLPNSTAGFRRTSYGLNDFLMAHNPAHAYSQDPDDPDVQFERLSKIRNPANTMGFGIVVFHGESAGSDHFHPENWLFQEMPPPEYGAASYVQTNAHGGPARTWDARSGYSFLDGHVGTYKLSDVVMPGNAAEMNKLDPRAAVAYAAQRWINE
jgi:prepilin-type N-terminal cleavage/methylation domain-containing protein